MVRTATSARLAIDYHAPACAWRTCDVYYPSDDCTPRPTLIFIGGGGWSCFEPFNDHAVIVRDAVARGFVAVIVRHRPVRISILAPVLVACMLLLPWLSPLLLLSLAALALALAELISLALGAVPMAGVLHDCACAVGFVHSQLAQQVSCLDPERLVFCGNSSGGHLLSLLALDPRWLSAVAVPRAHVRAVVDVSGVQSLESPLLLPFRLAILGCFLDCDASAAASLSPLCHVATVCPTTAFYLISCE